MDEDEDSFLYGDSVQNIPPPAQKEPVADLPSYDFDDLDDLPKPNEAPERKSESAETEVEEEKPTREMEQEKPAEPVDDERMNEDGEEEDEEVEVDEDSEDDVEIIMEPVVRSLDFRTQRGGHRPVQGRTPSSSITAPQANNLTTEYTPRERGAVPDSFKAPPTTPSKQFAPPQGLAASISAQPSATSEQPDDGIDTSTLAPARAPPSHPAIDPTIPGNVEGRPVFDVDMTNLADKAWRRPGSDLSDWFNYGFDELSWEAYCYRRRDIGEAAAAYKTTVLNSLNFAGLQEDQLLAAPPEMRTMVMTGTNAMMNVPPPGAGPNVVGPPGMIPPGMNPMGGINPMMPDMGPMGGMGPLGMGPPMGMGLNGDMGVGMPGAPGMGGMVPEGGMPGGHPHPNQVPNQNMNNRPHGSSTPEVIQPNLPDGQGQGIGSDGPGMQENATQQQQQPQIHTNSDGSGTPTQPALGRGSPAAQFRGRAGVAIAPRGRGGFIGRGRGIPTAPASARGPSPLPPNVPTGPRNPGNRYKDRDTNAPDVGGLDYGGNKDNGGNMDRNSEERTSRKRRSPPSVDDDRIGRSSKRR